MTDDQRPSRRHAAFFDIEKDPERDALTRPASVLRSTEWGGLTLLSLLAGLAFPPYFLSVMALAFLNAGGMLWVTHLNEAGRKRLREFEAEFARGHALEEGGDFRAAAELYTALAPRYEDQPKIAEIAVRRVAHLREAHPEVFARQPKSGPKASPASPRAGRSQAPSASSSASDPEPKPSAARQGQKPQKNRGDRQGRPAKEAGMKCPACGMKTPSQARFCPRCGKPLHAEAGRAQDPAWEQALQRFVRGDYAGAASQLQGLLKAGGAVAAKARAWTGHALFFQGREAEAEAAYREALEASPGLWGAAYQMGALAFAAGRHEDALKSFTHASGIEPDLESAPLSFMFSGPAAARARVQLFMGLCLRELGRASEAETSLERSISLDAANPLPYGVLGSLLMASGRYAEAALRFSAALETVTDEQGLISLNNDLGVAYFQAGDLDQAATAFKRVLKARPDDPNALHNLGMLYLKRGLGEELRRDFREFLKADQAEQLLLGLTRSLVEGARGAPLSVDTGIVGQSPAIQDTLHLVDRAARTDANVLILGENGTGKELVARAIHRLGHRSKGPFVAVNCAALPETLLESELFGHEKGAFTGAAQARPGRFELAQGGTLFLDEIGDLRQSLQVKLLRVVQEKAFERLGGTRTLKPDFRLIAATHQDLRRAVVEGRFREDLFYRLFVLPIELAPLRERVQDIPLLAEHFLRRFAGRAGRGVQRLAPQAVESLLRHAWPGNVRELENCLERAVAMQEGEVLSTEDLQLDAFSGVRGEGAGAEAGAASAGPWKPAEAAERAELLKALERQGRTADTVAASLGLSRATLYRKIAKYRLGSLKIENLSQK